MLHCLWASADLGLCFLEGVLGIDREEKLLCAGDPAEIHTLVPVPGVLEPIAHYYLVDLS